MTTWENFADTLTKHVGRDAIGKHMKGAASKIEEGRHELMPECEAEEEGEWGYIDEGDEEETMTRKEEDEGESIYWIC